MNGGGSQSPSYSTGNSGGSSSFGQTGMGAGSNYTPFSMRGYQPQNQQQSLASLWASLSPSLNAFSQMAAQGQQSPLNAQQDIQTAMQQQAAITSAQPTSAPTQNFTLADANQTAGLPAAGQAPPPPPAAAPPITPPTPAAPPALQLDSASPQSFANSMQQMNSMQQQEYQNWIRKTGGSEGNIGQFNQYLSTGQKTW